MNSINLSVPEQNACLRRMFGDSVSSGQIKVVEDEVRIIGKFAEVSILDTGGIDVWVVTPDRQPIGARKLNILVNAVLAVLPDLKITKLDGEAWFQPETLPKSLFKPLGIRQKRQLTDEQREKLRQRMKENLHD